MRQLSIYGFKNTSGDNEPRLLENMAEHCQFIRTCGQGDQPRNDLGNCIIQTSFPYLVFKLHAFQTNHPKEERAKMAQENHDAFIMERHTASMYARCAKRENCSTQTYVEAYEGKTYDEEFDEHRLVSKVQGYNIYLECYGSLMKEFEPDLQRVANIMQRATAYAYATFVKRDLQACLSVDGDAQLCDDWHDDEPPLESWTEIKRAIPYAGIGHDKIDPQRRPERKVRMKLTPEEVERHQRKEIRRIEGETF